MTDRMVWFCKIGGPRVSLPGGSDFPMRVEVSKAYKDVTGCEEEFMFSGWGGSLDECELAVVENRLPAPPPERPKLDKALASLLNSYSAENGSNTPDFILAEYMLSCLRAFERASRDREAWYGIPLRIGMGAPSRLSENGGEK
jgi:hypothetical protein